MELRKIEEIAGEAHVWCAGCKDWKMLSEFNKLSSDKLGIQRSCRECMNARAKRWRQRLDSDDKTQAANYSRRYRYALTNKQYKEMWEAQKGLCGICSCELVQDRGKNGHIIDHCHETDIVRGLLCRSCNSGLGLFKDSIEFLSSAIRYLEQHQKVTKDSDR